MFLLWICASKAYNDHGLACVDPFSGSECVDPEDPTVIAETELLGAAASIEAAAKKLEQLKPRAKPKVEVPLSTLSTHTNPRTAFCH